MDNFYCLYKLSYPLTRGIGGLRPPGPPGVSTHVRFRDRVTLGYRGFFGTQTPRHGELG